jgi:hypothetical protein
MRLEVRSQDAAIAKESDVALHLKRAAKHAASALLTGGGTQRGPALMSVGHAGHRGGPLFAKAGSGGGAMLHCSSPFYCRPWRPQRAV